MRISAAVLRQTNTPLSIESIDLDEPRADEVRVRVLGTGVCHTDVSLTQGKAFPVPLPIVLGHEASGVVEEVGARVRNVAVGDRVVVSFDHCTTCKNCVSGEPSYCDKFYLNFIGRRVDGSPTLSEKSEQISGNFFGQSSFATHIIAKSSNVIRIPEELPAELMGPLACGVQTGAGAIMNALRPSAGDNIAIFGAGAVGLSAVMAAKLMGLSTIVVIDLHPQRLELARELGATHTVDGSQTEVLKELAGIAPRGLQYTLDASGAPSAIGAAIDCLGVRGACGVVGGGPPVTVNMAHMLQGGRTIRGIGMGDSNPTVFIPRLMDFYKRGMFPLERLVTYYSLTDINVAIADSVSGKTIKPIIKM